MVIFLPLRRKRELYDLEWNVDIAKATVVGAPFGGPMGNVHLAFVVRPVNTLITAISRDEKQILLITGNQGIKPQTQIFTSSGSLISSFVVNYLNLAVYA